MSLEISYVNRLDDIDYSKEYRESFPARNAAKMSHEWTKSEHVRKLFEAIYDLYDLPKDVQVSLGSKWTYQWTKGTSIGYLYAKGAYGVGFPDIGRWEHQNGNEWDVRFCTARGSDSPQTTELAPESDWRESLPDLPECYTDYASTIFVIDNPAIINALVATGHYKMPKIAKKEVFLSLSPTFVEENPVVSDIIEAAKADGDVFDIRDWYESGIIVRGDECRDPIVPVEWMGELPDKIAESKLANKLSEVVSSARGSVITGYKSTKYGRIKDVQSCLNVANALALDPEFITLPTIAAGKKISSNSKWAKFEDSNRISFSGEKYSDKMREIDEKIDELADIIRFWEKAREDYRFSILLDESDLKDASFVFEKISALGKLIGVDDYVDTYNFGVPADDILA